jgi:hypothetical protein|eukprot:COSAG01_NODE_5730_length_4070_cov_3.481994_5_plen_164_part_00
MRTDSSATRGAGALRTHTALVAPARAEICLTPSLRRRRCRRTPARALGSTTSKKRASSAQNTLLSPGHFAPVAAGGLHETPIEEDLPVGGSMAMRMKSDTPMAPFWKTDPSDLRQSPGNPAAATSWSPWCAGAPVLAASWPTMMLQPASTEPGAVFVSFSFRV